MRGLKGLGAALRRRAAGAAGLLGGARLLEPLLGLLKDGIPDGCWPHKIQGLKLNPRQGTDLQLDDLHFPGPGLFSLGFRDFHNPHGNG